MHHAGVRRKAHVIQQPSCANVTPVSGRHKHLAALHGSVADSSDIVCCLQTISCKNVGFTEHRTFKLHFNTYVYDDKDDHFKLLPDLAAGLAWQIYNARKALTLIDNGKPVNLAANFVRLLARYEVTCCTACKLCLPLISLVRIFFQCWRTFKA